MESQTPGIKCDNDSGTCKDSGSPCSNDATGVDACGGTDICQCPKCPDDSGQCQPPGLPPGLGAACSNDGSGMGTIGAGGYDACKNGVECKCLTPSPEPSLSPSPGPTSGPSLGANCWEAYLPNYPNCGGYSSAGYTCVGDYCAAMDPGGTPNTCAVDKGANYVVDQATGRCSPSPGPTGSAGAVCSGHGTCDAGTPASTGDCTCLKNWEGTNW